VLNENSHLFAKNIITKLNALHLNYSVLKKCYVLIAAFYSYFFFEISPDYIKNSKKLGTK